MLIIRFVLFIKMEICNKSWAKLTYVYLFTEEKAMYSAELEKHKREKVEWRNKAESLEEIAAALQVSLNSHVH